MKRNLERTIPFVEGGGDSPLLVTSKQVSNSDIREGCVALDNCRNNHEFKRLYCTGCGKWHDVPVYCGDRFCPVCGVSRRARVRDRLKWILNQIRFSAPYRMKFLTLTVPSQGRPDKMCRHLISSFRRLRQRAAWKKRVMGGAFVIEVKRGNFGWHCHIHALVVMKYWKWQELLKLWTSVSGGKGVYLENVHGKDLVYYLTKYITKPPVADAFLVEANSYLKGVRLFSPFGDWYHINRTYVKPKFVCPHCGASSWIIDQVWEKLGECYGPLIPPEKTVEIEIPPTVTNTAPMFSE